MKNKNLTLTRGDTQTLTINLKDKTGEPIIVSEEGQLYFTVKGDYNITDYLFQKRIGHGIEYNENGGYSISILSEDTENLEFGNYVFDIEYKDKGIVKTVLIGEFVITKEVTYTANEV